MLLEVKKKSGAFPNGFTLVEIIIVMALIAVLSMLSIAGYLQYRKSAILNLSADSIVSQINSQKDKAVLGAYKSQRADEIRNELDALPGNSSANGGFDSKCFTVLFEKGADGKFLAYTSQKDFSGKKFFQGDSWVYEGCKDVTNGSFPKNELFELDSLIKIDDVSIGNFASGGQGTPVSQSLEVRFLPPDGKIEVLYDGVSGKTGYGDVELKIDISYGDNNPDYKKSIFFKL